jgi:acyl-CoA synthetase (NDP forming)
MNLAIITISGGAGAIMSDWCEKESLKLPILSENGFKKLSQIFPSWMPPNRFSLIDIWPAVENAAGDFEKILLQCLDIILSEPDIPVLFLTAFYSSKNWPVDWNKVADLMKKYKKPIFIWLFGQYQDVLIAEHLFQELKMPVFNSEKEMVSVLKKIAKNASIIAFLSELHNPQFFQ